ncbi:hypothetical protein LEMLEM_LOCUS302 [Lemmus lemmus]
MVPASAPASRFLPSARKWEIEREAAQCCTEERASERARERASTWGGRSCSYLHKISTRWDHSMLHNGLGDYDARSAVNGCWE